MKSYYVARQFESRAEAEKWANSTNISDDMAEKAKWHLIIYHSGDDDLEMITYPVNGPLVNSTKKP